VSAETDNFPVYQPPGIPHIDPKDQKGLVKMINKALKPKLRTPKIKGLQSDQSVHVKHKKVKFY